MTYQNGQFNQSALTKLLSVARQNALALMTVLGGVGGFIGFAISEFVNDDSKLYESEGQMMLDTGKWFALAMLGVGAAMSLSQGLLERNVEKSKVAALRTIPASLVGGFIAGVIAQKIYSALFDISLNVVPRAIAWGVAGCLAGVAIGAGFGSLVRLRNATIGGAIGGIFGGIAFNIVGSIFSGAMASRLVGLTIIGTLIGAAIALIDFLTTGAFLEMAMPEGPPVRFPLIGRTHIIGCANSASVAILRDPGIREQHVRLDVQANNISFACVTGAPPVLLNGMQVDSGSLKNGDSLVVGNTQLRVLASRRSIAGLTQGHGTQYGATPPVSQQGSAARTSVGMSGHPGNSQPSRPNISGVPSDSGSSARPIIQIRPPKE